MARSCYGRSIEITSGFRVQVLRASLILVCAVLCTNCPKPSPEESADIPALRKENEELRRDLADASKKYMDAANLLGDIADKLASMTTKEVEIRGLQEELDPATYEVSEDLRQKILGDLKNIDDNLKESKEKERQFSELTGADQSYAALRRTAANLRIMLDEKEQTIAALQGNLDRLAVRAAELEKEVEKGRETISTLEKNSRERDAQQEEVIAALRREIGT